MQFTFHTPSRSSDFPGDRAGVFRLGLGKGGKSDTKCSINFLFWRLANASPSTTNAWMGFVGTTANRQHYFDLGKRTRQTNFQTAGESRRPFGFLRAFGDAAIAEGKILSTEGTERHGMGTPEVRAGEILIVLNINV